MRFYIFVHLNHSTNANMSVHPHNDNEIEHSYSDEKVSNKKIEMISTNANDSCEGSRSSSFADLFRRTVPSVTDIERQTSDCGLSIRMDEDDNLMAKFSAPFAAKLVQFYHSKIFPLVILFGLGLPHLFLADVFGTGQVVGKWANRICLVFMIVVGCGLLSIISRRVIKYMSAHSFNLYVSDITQIKNQSNMSVSIVISVYGQMCILSQVPGSVSLHLTTDLKYLTIGGQNGDCCVVLQIK